MTRHVLITGAGSGLGRALALCHARAGDVVAVADIRLDRAEETVQLLPGSGHLALPVDIADDASVQALHDALAARWQRLDVVVNNAGVSSGGGLLDAPMDEWRWMLDVNLLGVVRGCRAFAPWLVRQGSGHIVNVASFAGLAGAPNMMTYGVAKAGVVALSEQLRAEMHDRGVRVSVVCPSFFRTNLCENFRGDEKIRHVATKLMDTATVTADGVAAYVHAAALRGEFMILPTKAERLRWRLKRWLPGVYFRKLLELTRGRAALANAGK